MNNRWEYTYTQNIETTINPKITQAQDNLYGLTKIQDTTNPVTIQYKSSGIPGYSKLHIALTMIILSIYYNKKQSQNK